MEEVLYIIDILKDKNGYLGKLYSDIDGVKEFRGDYLDKLLRDISIDIQLAFEEFSNRISDTASEYPEFPETK